jgi:hypothetical protein
MWQECAVLCVRGQALSQSSISYEALMREDWIPCRFINYREFLEEEDIVARFGLLFDEFGSTQQFLESQGFMGGGYTWHGIVESMIRKKDAALNAELHYDPEGSMFCVRSSNQNALRTVRECIRTALADSEVLQDAIDSADPSFIE